MADISKVLLDNFMPYAKGTIIDRAIPYIDGLKPVNRRILYAMYELKLWDKKVKSNRIVGDTMGKYHPHGDASIYQALIRMVDNNETLNEPYLTGQGNFGKIWSEEISPAHMRYTEAGLAPISKELFEGIEENAVDMVYNFDNTEKEPVILPVKFPSILVNTSSGIAVGMGSYIPSFNLKEVCLATIDILKGKATKPEDLVDILVAPDFRTGGYVHISKEDMLKLLTTGSGSITMTGEVQLFKDKILVNSLPYNVTADSFVKQITDIVNSGKDSVLKEISNVIDATSLNGMQVEIQLKRNADVRAVLKKLYKYTDLRKKISFTTRIIYEDKPRELGIFELLELWVDFRVKTVKRIYTHRLNKAIDKEYWLSAWEKIKHDVENIAVMISSNTEELAKSNLMKNYDLAEDQAEYLLDKKIKAFTKDNINKLLKELGEVRDIISEIKQFLSDDVLIKNHIAEELQKIIDKYGHDRITKVMPPVVENEREEEEAIPDMDVWVIVTNKGNIKRVLDPMDALKAENWLSDGEEIIKTIKCRNIENILVITYNGFCYKIPVYSIESSRGSFKSYIWDLADKKEESEILYITNSGDYNKYFNVIYHNGKGRKVHLSAVSGPRKKYQGLFEPGTPKTLFATESDEFFIITYKRKAAYADLKPLNVFGSRCAFKIARIPGDDAVFGIQPVDKVPDMSAIDLSKYTKGYVVSIKDDVLWTKKN